MQFSSKEQSQFALHVVSEGPYCEQLSFLEPKLRSSFPKITIKDCQLHQLNDLSNTLTSKSFIVLQSRQLNINRFLQMQLQQLKQKGATIFMVPGANNAQTECLIAKNADELIAMIHSMKNLKQKQSVCLQFQKSFQKNPKTTKQKIICHVLRSKNKEFNTLIDVLQGKYKDSNYAFFNWVEEIKNIKEDSYQSILIISQYESINNNSLKQQIHATIRRPFVILFKNLSTKSTPNADYNLQTSSILQIQNVINISQHKSIFQIPCLDSKRKSNHKTNSTQLIRPISNVEKINTINKQHTQTSHILVENQNIKQDYLISHAKLTNDKINIRSTSQFENYKPTQICKPIVNSMRDIKTKAQPIESQRVSKLEHVHQNVKMQVIASPKYSNTVKTLKLAVMNEQKSKDQSLRKSYLMNKVQLPSPVSNKDEPEYKSKIQIILKQCEKLNESKTQFLEEPFLLFTFKNINDLKNLLSNLNTCQHTILITDQGFQTSIQGYFKKFTKFNILILQKGLVCPPTIIRKNSPSYSYNQNPKILASQLNAYVKRITNSTSKQKSAPANFNLLIKNDLTSRVSLDQFLKPKTFSHQSFCKVIDRTRTNIIVIEQEDYNIVKKEISVLDKIIILAKEGQIIDGDLHKVQFTTKNPQAISGYLRKLSSQGQGHTRVLFNYQWDDLEQQIYKQMKGKLIPVKYYDQQSLLKKAKQQSGKNLVIITNQNFLKFIQDLQKNKNIVVLLYQPNYSVRSDLKMKCFKTQIQLLKELESSALKK